MATNIILEHQWTPVKLGGSSSYATLSNTNSGAGYSANATWYNQYVSLEGDRRSKLTMFDMMDRSSVEVSKAMDIIAEDMSSSNADNDRLFHLDYEDDTKITKTMLKTYKSMLHIWTNRTSLEVDLFAHCRELVKYGGIFFSKRPDGGLRKIPHEKLVGYVLSPEDDSVVTHYLVDWEAPYLNIRENFRKVEKIDSAAKQRAIQHISVEDMVIIKRGTTPFGESILERAYPLWRKLDLLENAIVIYRVTRSSEKMVFYVDVGRTPPKKHPEIINKYRLQMKQRKVISSNAQQGIDTEFDPHSMSENFFLPVTSQGRSSKIETLPGGSNVGELSDLTYFARKLAAAMRVPPSMIDIQSSDGDRDTYSDMRVGQVYQIEMRYLGFVNRDKRAVERALREHFCWFCMARDIVVDDEIGFRINDSHNFALYKNIETNQSLLNLFQTTTQMGSLSKKFAMLKYLNLSKEEIVDNEVMALMEKGATDEMIRKMPPHVIDNVVYGDGSLGEQYGLKPSDGVGRGMF